MEFPRRSSLPLVLLVALAAAGCGGPDRAEYSSDLSEVGGKVDAALEALPETDRATLGPQEVDQVAEELRAAADDLEGLEPPDDAAKPQARLEQGMRGVAAAFEQLADDLRATESDQEKGELFVSFSTDTDVEAAFEDISSAQEAYVEAGYRVFGAGAGAAK
ncbi:MAG: hypothetical protein JWO69_2 [Thermoleophilia bacterium]|nr:hypothetical protein [Thermoleophilia bacterium]